MTEENKQGEATPESVQTDEHVLPDDQIPSVESIRAAIKQSAADESFSKVEETETEADDTPDDEPAEEELTDPGEAEADEEEEPEEDDESEQSGELSKADLDRERIRLEVRAEDLGLDPEVIADMGDKALKALVERELSRKDDGKPEQKKQEAPADEEDELDFTEELKPLADVLDEDAANGVKAALKKIEDRYKQRDQQARTQIESVLNAQYMTEFAMQVQPLTSEYAEHIGDGVPWNHAEDSQIGKNLLKVNEKAMAIAEANNVSIAQARREAVEALFGKQARQKATAAEKKDKDMKFAKARRQRTPRPTAREASGRADESPEDRERRAEKAVAERMRQLGLAD